MNEERSERLRKKLDRRQKLLLSLRKGSISMQLKGV